MFFMKTYGKSNLTSISLPLMCRNNDSGEYGALHMWERDIINYWFPVTAGEVTWLGEKKAILILILLNLKVRLKEGNLYWAAVNFVVWGILTWNVIKGFVIYYLSGPLWNIFCGLCSGRKKKTHRNMSRLYILQRTITFLWFPFN